MIISIDDFVADLPTSGHIAPAQPVHDEALIEGVTVTSLSRGEDSRGYLNELLSTRDSTVEPIVHVYQVHAAPKSIRAWIVHKQQTDRLAFTQGDFRVVLFDIRTESPTYGKVNVLDGGAARQCLVRIPSLVVHGVQNRGFETSSFVNLPTRVYDSAHPDKWRVMADYPGIPYRFEDG